MNEVHNEHQQYIDINIQLIDSEIMRRQAEHAAEISLQLGRVAMDYSRVERVPRYDTESRESDVEHSFMLQLVAVELAETFFPDLDSGLVAKFSGVHDLPELLSGDVPTFHTTEEMLHKKDQAEQLAIKALESILPPRTYSLLLRYEKQEEPEARLVRFIDKLLPIIVDIHGPGLMVLKEDYNVETLAEYLDADEKQVDRCKSMFPEKNFALIHEVRSVLSNIFARDFK